MNSLTTRLRRLLPNLLPHLTCAKRVSARELAARPAFWPYIMKQRNFLKKKNLNDLMNTLNAVSLISRHGITSNYSTDRGIIETSLKTSFSRSHFSLFSPILTGQIPAFPRKGKSPVEEVEQILRTNVQFSRESVTTAWPTGVTGMWGFSLFSFESFCGVFPVSVSNRSRSSSFI